MPTIRPGVTGDLSEDVEQSRVTGLDGDRTPGFRGNKVTGRPGRTNVLLAASVGTAIASGVQANVTVIAPVQAGDLNTTLTLTSSSTGTLPFTIGHAFRQGEVPAGFGVTISGATTQVTPKNTWPDGSLKFAVIAGTYSQAVANSPVTVTLTKGTSPTGTALTIADLKTAMTGQSCSIGCGAFGTASWSGTDWDTPFQAWVIGHRMSSWIYRKPVGADAHLVAWIEVRLYAGGVVEVLPWIENGYLLVAGPTNKSATYTFTLGGTQRFSQAIDIPHHTRTVLVNGAILSHWLGSDPGVTARHNPSYLMDTELVPAYAVSLNNGNGRVAALPTSFSPFQIGSFTFSGDDMASPGYQEPIGLLPEHDVLYLTAPPADSAKVYRSVVWNGYSAGRWPVHYRDETTNRAPLFSSYPTLVLAGGSSSTGTYTPTPSGTAPPSFDHAHHPSVGYMAYLVTGRWYFMEECQLVTTAMHFAKNNLPDLRDGAKGLVATAPGVYQLRAGAWSLRTKATAFAATPDADTALRNAFKQSMQDNIDYFFTKYAGQGGNTFGLVNPGSTLYGPSPQDGTDWYAFWQDDFMTAAWGWTLALDFTLDAGYKTKLQSFFAWKAKGIAVRTGAFGSAWPYTTAAVYEANVSAVNLPDYLGGTGPFLSATDAYANTVAFLNSVGFGDTVGTVDRRLGGTRNSGEEFPQASQPGHWQNMMPALAYAVRHGASGALAGYQRIVGASNYYKLQAGWLDKPVWSVKPARGHRPAWLEGAAVGEWKQIAGTSAPGEVKDYCGLAWIDDANGVQCISAANGGHGGNLTNNRVMRLRLEADAPVWETLRAADSSAGYDATGLTSAYLPSGKPAPRHTYTDITYVPELNRVLVGGRFWGSSAADWTVVDGFNLATLDWDPAGTFANRPSSGTYLAARDPATGIWYGTGGFKFTPGATPAASAYSAFTLSGAPTTGVISNAFDTKRDRIFHLSSGNGFSFTNSFTVNACVINKTTGAKTAIAFNASAAWTTFQAKCNLFVTSALVYDPDADCFYFYNGGQISDGEDPARIFKIIPNSTNTWDMEVLATTGLTPANSIGSDQGGVLTKFYYVSRWRTLVLVRGSQNVYYLRTA